MKRFPGFFALAYVFAVASVWLCMGCSSSSTTTSMDGGETSSDAKTSSDSSHGETGGMCSGGKMSCGGTCVDLSTSADNCGTCGSSCGKGLVCSKGTCALSCTGGDSGTLTQCGGGCYDLKTDSNNCGTCNHSCSNGESCSDGVCGQSCGTGSMACASGCTDILTDNANCGGCSTAKTSTACVSGTVCSGGKCTTSCASNLHQCTGDAGSECVDFQSDVHNCGSCGNQCAANSVCSAGQCQGSCTAPLVDCNGGCIDPTSSAQYCGATGSCGVDGGTAGTACVASAGQTCVNGSCAVVCTTGELLCGGKCINPQTDNTYCGASGSSCTGAMACPQGQVCTDGSCKANCDPGQIVCGGTCVNPQTDLGFCGASGDCTGMNKGQGCPAGDVCSGGVCQLTCSPGYVNCPKGGQPTCIQPSVDLNFCGASSDCQNGDQGADCTSTTQGFGSGYLCNNGLCALSCTAGFINCDSTCINSLTNNQHCGTSPACGVVCPAGQVCTMGSCQTSCLAGEVECGGNCIDPTTDSFFCGAVGNCGNSAQGPTGSVGANCSNTPGSACTAGSCSCPATDVMCTISGIPTCVNAATSNQYCGCLGASQGQNCSTLGVASPIFGEGSTCAGGSCACPGTVQGPEEIVCSVGATPTCVDQFTDNAFCGATGNCAGANKGQNCSDPVTGIAGSNCSNGSCVCSVNPSDSVQEINCGGTCTDPHTSTAFCGAAGLCNSADPPNTGNSVGVMCGAIEICQAGHCVPDCATGQTYCGAGGPAPFCADTQNDNVNCGTGVAGCGHMCTNGNTCTNGVCGPSCTSGQTLCPGASAPNPATPYCANTATDNNNCGASIAGCGNVCLAPATCGSNHCVPPGVLEVTSCGQTGANGPSQAQCNGAYTGGPLAGVITVGGGIQQWTVPVTGVYTLEAIGAQGQSAQGGGIIGGFGADMKGDFTLTAGTVLSIVVGQLGGVVPGANGGGGGGSFVVNGTTPLLVAGGGGGTRTQAAVNGFNASTGPSGVSGNDFDDGVSGDICAGGTAEGGGGQCVSWGSGGGGFIGDGTPDAEFGVGGGASFLDGAVGGVSYDAAVGGFGCGGSGDGRNGGGGGGGYSGGGGGWIAGGGGSFNSGANASNSIAVGGGVGVVFITVP